MPESLAPGGRVALLEYRTEQDPATIGYPIPPDHKMSIEQVMKEWSPAGFELVELHEFLPAQHFFIFRREGQGESTPWHRRSEIAPAKFGETPNLASLGGYVYFAGQPKAEDFRLPLG